MKKNLFLAAAVILGFAACAEKEDMTEYVELTYSGILNEEESYWLGTDSTNLVGYYYQQDLRLPPFTLTHYFNSYGFGFGFTVCNQTDTQTPGYMNLSAIAGKGVSGDNYLTVSTGGDAYGLSATISVEDGYYAESMYVTNATYPYLAITTGDDGYGECSMVKEWTSTDFFSLAVSGYYKGAMTNSITIMMANGMDVINDWQYVDLRPLGKIDSIKFSMSSSDMGELGMNTPAYFCMDKFTVSKE